MGMDVNLKKLKKNPFRYSKVRGELQYNLLQQQPLHRRLLWLFVHLDQ